MVGNRRGNQWVAVVVTSCALGVLGTCGACGDSGGGGGDDHAAPDADVGGLTPQPLVQDPAVATGCLPEPVAAGQSRAKYIACAGEIPAGPLASGRPGDIVLENAQIEIVIRAFGDGYTLPGSWPGNIVDAAPVGGRDELKELQPLVDINGAAFDEFVITEAGDDGPATAVVRGPAAQLPFFEAFVQPGDLDAIIEARYILEPDTRALRVVTTVFGGAGATGSAQQGAGFFLGGRIQVFAPGRGFLQGVVNTEMIASSGSETTSYGLAYSPDAARSVQFINIGGLVVLLGPAASLSDPRPLEFAFIVGDGSIGSVTEEAWAVLGTPTGTIAGAAAPGSAVAVRSGDALIARARADQSGHYRVAVPVGVYSVRSESRDPEAADQADGPAQTATVAAGQEVALDIVPGAAGRITVDATENFGEADQRIPARVVAFNSTGYRQIRYTDGAAPAEMRLPPGEYIVLVSRGMEYDAFTATPVVVTDGSEESFQARLTRAVDTTGWISVDTHLHSEMSSDSTYPLEPRLRAVAGEGVEIAISTDHDFVTNYAPLIEQIGLQRWLASQVGEEISSNVWGHMNAWPLPEDPDTAAGGALHWYFVSPGTVMERVRDRSPAGVLQINHPRAEAGKGLFTSIDFEPTSGRARANPDELGLPADTDLDAMDFDAIEVGNGFNPEKFAATWNDWIHMIAAGRPVTATGSSDSHFTSDFAGESRTFVYVGAGNDDPATVDMAVVNESLRAGRVAVGQGAFVQAGIERPGDGGISLPGELVNVSGQSELRVWIKIQAPPWMPLGRAQIFTAPDAPALTLNLDANETATLRYEGTVTLPLAVGQPDAFVIVRVLPAGTGLPVFGQPDASFTNPLFADTDGDGAWNPIN